MPDIPQGTEVYGIGAVAIALITLVWKIWSDSNKRADKIMDIVEKNTVAQVQLAEAVKANTDTTKRSDDSLRQHTNAMNLLVEIIKNGKHRI